MELVANDVLPRHSVMDASMMNFLIQYLLDHHYGKPCYGECRIGRCSGVAFIRNLEVSIGTSGKPELTANLDRVPSRNTQATVERSFKNNRTWRSRITCSPSLPSSTTADLHVHRSRQKLSNQTHHEHRHRQKRTKCHPYSKGHPSTVLTLPMHSLPP